MLIAAKGFGFIEDKNGLRVFFHAKECGGKFDELRKGDVVNYRLIKDPDGRHQAHGVECPRLNGQAPTYRADGSEDDPNAGQWWRRD